MKHLKIRMTEKQIKWFVQEQEQYGTRTAVYNLLWMFQRHSEDFLYGAKANKRQAGVKKARKAGRNGAALGGGRTQEPVRKPSQRPRA